MNSTSQVNTPENDASTGECAQNVSRARAGTPHVPASSVKIELLDIGRRLSRGERRLLLVLLEPHRFRSGASECAKAAGISRRRYNIIMAKPDFQQLVRVAHRSAVQAHTGPIVAASIETAMLPTAEGYPDRAMLLQMAGFIDPKRVIHRRGDDPKPTTCGVVGVAMESFETSEQENTGRAPEIGLSND